MLLPLFPKKHGGNGSGGATDIVNVRYTTFQEEPKLYNFDTVLAVASERLRIGDLALSGAIVVIGAELFRGENIQDIFKRIINQSGNWRATVGMWGGTRGAIEFRSILQTGSSAESSDFQIIRVAPSTEHLNKEPDHSHMRQYWLRVGDERRGARLIVDWTRYPYREHRGSQRASLHNAVTDAQALLKRLRGNDRSVVNEAMAKAILMEAIARRLDNERPIGEPRVMGDDMNKMIYEIWLHSLGMSHPPVPPILRYKVRT